MNRPLWIIVEKYQKDIRISKFVAWYAAQKDVTELPSTAQLLFWLFSQSQLQKFSHFRFYFLTFDVKQVIHFQMLIYDVLNKEYFYIRQLLKEEKLIGDISPPQRPQIIFLICFILALFSKLKRLKDSIIFIVYPTDNATNAASLFCSPLLFLVEVLTKISSGANWSIFGFECVCLF